MSIWPYTLYFEKNSYKNCVKSLENALNIGGVDHIIVSFITADNYKKCTDSTFLNDINAFVSSGGNIRISFGSKTGDDIMLDEAIIDDDELYNIYVEIITKFSCYDLDFFIVGENLLKNQVVHERRLRVLKRLQNEFINLKISFSISHNHFSFIENVISNEININIVNCVFQQNKNDMSYYIDGISDCKSIISNLNKGTFNIRQQGTFTDAVDRRQGTFNIRRQGTFSLGVCVTIGMGCDENGNFIYDDNSFFSLQHAESLVEFINSNDHVIDSISYLYLHRDTFSSSDPNMCSLCNVEDFDFYNIFSKIKKQNLKNIFIKKEKEHDLLKIENCIFNSYKNNWIVADNIIMGESSKYSYKEIKNKDINQLLESLEKDDNVCVVNYSLSDGKAYIKTGFDKNNKNDYTFINNFKCFIKKE